MLAMPQPAGQLLVIPLPEPAATFLVTSFANEPSEFEVETILIVLSLVQDFELQVDLSLPILK
jgi:hypothetical protein